MEIEVFNSDKESIALIDTFQSLIINKRYYKANKFELVVALNPNNTAYLKNGHFLLIEGVFYYIDAVMCDDSTSGELTISGVSLFGLLRNRIIWENYSKQARPEQICGFLLDRHVISPTDTNRQLDLIVRSSVANLTPDSIQYQRSYGVVREEIEELCETYDFGFKEVAGSDVQSDVQFYKGNDLSDAVEFSQSFDNLLNESFESSDFDERNVALVAGEGEGSARKLITLNNGLTGVDRKELYVDAKDLQKANDDVTMTDAEYDQALINRGKSKLSETQKILILNGEIDTRNELYEYGVDYDLGDRVRITSDLFNLTYTDVITEIQETYDSNGKWIEPTFGRRSPTLIDIIKRK